MATIEATNEPKTITTVSTRRIALYGVYAAITASVVAVAVLFIGLAIAQFPGEYVGGPFGPLAVGPVVINSAIAAVGATIVYGIISRYAANPDRAFVIAAGVALVLSFGMFLAPNLTGAPLRLFAFLAVLHVTAAVSIVGVLLRAGSPVGESR